MFITMLLSGLVTLSLVQILQGWEITCVHCQWDANNPGSNNSSETCITQPHEEGNATCGENSICQEPVGDHFNLESHKWEDMIVVVIDHNPNWRDAERKRKEIFWMYRLQSFRPKGVTGRQGNAYYVMAPDPTSGFKETKLEYIVIGSRFYLQKLSRECHFRHRMCNQHCNPTKSNICYVCCNESELCNSLPLNSNLVPANATASPSAAPTVYSHTSFAMSGISLALMISVVS